MNAKTWIPLALALVMGLVAALVGRSMMSHKPAALVAEKKSQMVVIKDGVEAGSILQATDVTVAAVPPDSVPAAGFNTPDKILGRTVSVSMTKGEPVTENLLVPTGLGAGLPALIPDGMRAITVEVNEFSGVAGLLVPGCHVDLVGTLGNQNTEETQTRTLAENIRVIAVGQRITNSPSPDGQPQGISRSITLLVTPKQAELVELSARFANPRMVLRNALDDSRMGESTGITLAEIRGHKEKPEKMIVPVVAPQPSTMATTLPTLAKATAPDSSTFRNVMIIKGGAVSTVVFQVASPGPESANTDPGTSATSK